MSGTILTFDIGSTIVKGGLFSSGGELLKSCSARVEMQGTYSSVFQEIDPLLWVNAVEEILKSLLSTTGRAGRNLLEAVVVSGNGPTLTVIDKSGKPLIPAMTWLDRRALTESEHIKGKTGVWIDPSFYLPKILWLRKHRRSIYEKADYFLSPAEYINYLLTGEPFMVIPGEGLENLIWTGELVEKLELAKDKFPPTVDIGAEVGFTAAAAETKFGIPRGVPVFAGGPDFAMAILGSGAVEPGSGCDRAGTSEGINICSSSPVQNSRLMCYRHVITPYWNVTGIISTTGKAVEWFQREFLPEISFDQLYSYAAGAEKGSGKLMFLPYLAGERAPLWDMHARGTFLGLSLHHGRKEMARAVLESTGFAIRDVLETMANSGVHTDELRIAGSAGRIEVWNQIKADITGKRVFVPEVSLSELTGGLCTALFGLGRFGSLKDASQKIVSIAKVFEPGNDRNIYDDLFNLYREGYRSLKELYGRLALID